MDLIVCHNYFVAMQKLSPLVKENWYPLIDQTKQNKKNPDSAYVLFFCWIFVLSGIDKNDSNSDGENWINFKFTLQVKLRWIESDRAEEGTYSRQPSIEYTRVIAHRWISIIIEDTIAQKFSSDLYLQTAIVQIEICGNLNQQLCGFLFACLVLFVCLFYFGLLVEFCTHPGRTIALFEQTSLNFPIKVSQWHIIEINGER